ncbi:N-acetyltransferase [Pseudomonas sp. NPDC089569]|uniref:N-acetyltransferase n=1 Tax=Pseudomonas sp. NPDC089569 TaxID=3390722 RepID=UPI003D08962F
MRRLGKGTDLRNQTFKSDARKLAYRAFIKKIAPFALNVDASNVSLEPITAAAIEKCHLWKGGVIYPWTDIPDWKRKDAKGLDLAIWYEQNLCGLCYATPRRSAICLKVVLLQGDPDKSHPLRGLIAPIAVLAADFYARMLGCREIEIQDPDPNVIFYYRDLGFDYDQGNRLVMYLSDQ